MPRLPQQRLWHREAGAIAGCRPAEPPQAAGAPRSAPMERDLQRDHSLLLVSAGLGRAPLLHYAVTPAELKASATASARRAPAPAATPLCAGVGAGTSALPTTLRLRRRSSCREYCGVAQQDLAVSAVLPAQHEQCGRAPAGCRLCRSSPAGPTSFVGLLSGAKPLLEAVNEYGSLGTFALPCRLLCTHPSGPPRLASHARPARRLLPCRPCTGRGWAPAATLCVQHWALRACGRPAGAAASGHAAAECSAATGIAHRGAAAASAAPAAPAATAGSTTAASAAAAAAVPVSAAGGCRGGARHAEDPLEAVQTGGQLGAPLAAWWRRRARGGAADRAPAGCWPSPQPLA